MTCGELSAGVVLDSCKRAIAGINSDVILINYADIDRVASVVTDNVITTLTLKATKKAYKFECRDGSPVGEVNLVKGKHLPGWDHILNLVAITKTEDIKKMISILAVAKIVAIVDNKEQGGATKATRYEVYGYDAGLELMESANTTEFADEIVYNLKLGTAEAKENAIPKSIFKTDAAATQIMVLGLLS